MSDARDKDGGFIFVGEEGAKLADEMLAHALDGTLPPRPTPSLRSYLSRDVGCRTPVWNYHLRKSCDAALIGLALTALLRLPLTLTVGVSVIGYWLAGKLWHNSDLRDVVADFVIGALAVVPCIAVDFGYAWGLTALAAWLSGYSLFVLKLRWASP